MYKEQTYLIKKDNCQLNFLLLLFPFSTNTSAYRKVQNSELTNVLNIAFRQLSGSVRSMFGGFTHGTICNLVEAVATRQPWLWPLTRIYLHHSTSFYICSDNIFQMLVWYLKICNITTPSTIRYSQACTCFCKCSCRSPSPRSSMGTSWCSAGVSWPPEASHGHWDELNWRFTVSFVIFCAILSTSQNPWSSWLIRH